MRLVSYLVLLLMMAAGAVQGCASSHDVSPQPSGSQLSTGTIPDGISDKTLSPSGKRDESQPTGPAVRKDSPAKSPGTRGRLLADLPGLALKQEARSPKEPADSIPSDRANTKIDDVPQLWMPNSGVAVGDLFGLFSAEPTPGANEYSRLRVSAEQNDPNAQYRLAIYQYRTVRDARSMVDWLRKAAAQNHVKAQLALGKCLGHGVGVTKAVDEALTWYRKAAEQGDAEAQFEFGWMYCIGQGIPQDYKEAAKWFTKAAEQGNLRAQEQLGSLYADGRGVVQNYKEAVKWYTQWAERGDPNAPLFLGTYYEIGAHLPKDEKEAVKWYIKAAERGNASAQCRLGDIYSMGKGIPRNYKEAAKWYTKAAEQGYPDAQYYLGYMYYNGEGVLQNYKEALRWFTEFVEHGHRDAGPSLNVMSKEAEEAERYQKWLAATQRADVQTTLGDMYRYGKGVPSNHAEAVRWYTRAAEQGYAEAQFDLGWIYHEGEGVRRDYAEAAKWYARAAKQGYADAQCSLGLMYDIGDGIQRDYRNAVDWYTKAAEQGHGFAQLLLGLKCKDGQGALEDYVEAYKWALLAGINGADAQSLKEELRMRMSPTQIEEAQQRARAFIDRQKRKPPRDSQSQKQVIATATGFLATTDGYLLTAQHAIEKASRIEVVHRQKTYSARVVVKDEAIDVAVLRIEGTGFPCLPLVSSATVKAGDPIFTIGFPQVALQGAEPKYTEGSISSLSGPSGSSRFFQISVPIQPGNSGGPLVDERGQVVGMVNARLNDLLTLATSGMVPQNVNYAVKSSFILPFLEGIEGLSPKSKAKDEAPVERSTAIERTKQALVMVVCY